MVAIHINFKESYFITLNIKKAKHCLHPCLTYFLGSLFWVIWEFRQIASHQSLTIVKLLKCTQYIFFDSDFFLPMMTFFSEMWAYFHGKRALFDIFRCSFQFYNRLFKITLSKLHCILLENLLSKGIQIQEKLDNLAWRNKLL